MTFFGHFWANFGYVSHIPAIRFCCHCTYRTLIWCRMTVVYIIVFDTSAKAQAWLGLIAHSLASLSCSLFNLPHLLHHSLRFAPLMVTFALMSNTIIYTTPLRFAPSLNCSPFKLISNPPFYTISYYSN